MNRRTKHPLSPSTPQRSDARRNGALERERERLEEEVRQLRAAVKVYAEIARRATERS